MAILSKKTMGFLYGMGAAVVIVGALFKLQHWTGADIMLIIGLLTEAAIFALSAFEPVEKDLDWSLVYPELAGGETSTKKGKGDNPA
jgi:gliding motility-associated protein GldL